MNEPISDDQIHQMLEEWTAYTHDRSQVDAMFLIFTDWAIGKSSALAETADEVLKSYLFENHLLARQLLDTGGRMRLDPEGQLDARDQPLATADSQESIRRELRAIHASVNKILAAGVPQAGSDEILRQQDRLSERLDGLFRAVSDRIADALSDMAAGNRPGQARIEALAAALDALGDRIEVWQDQAAIQLETLTGTVLALQPEPGPSLTEVLDREAADAEAVAEADEELATLADWEQELIEGRLLTIGDLLTPQWYPKAKPGCFYNPDNTITCRDCGQAKAPEQYYRDKSMATGRKSQCKDCEEGRTGRAA
jgi:hypothetical protein